MAVALLQVLERSELNKLPKGVQNKLEKFVTELQNANDALTTQHERFKADSEQQYFDIDKRLAESQEQIVSATKDLQALKEDKKKLTEELNALKGIEGESPEDKPSQQQTKAKYEIEAEKRELARLLEKRTQEVENLTEDVNRLNEKLAETSKVRMELQFKLDNIQSSEASVQHRENRMAQEKELLEKKIEWFAEELRKKTEELLNTGRVKGEEILELRSSLKTSTEQVASLEGQLAALKESTESQSRRAEDLNNKLKQARDAQSSMEEKYRNELNAHVKLSSLYKVSATDLERKNQELSRAVEELSRLLKDSGEANKALEAKASEGEQTRTRLEAELREKVKKLEKEVENATVKAAGKRCCGPSLSEEQLEATCPTAAAIAAVVKPGMKFFDLYNAFVECQTQLQLEKQETKRVSRVLDEIVQEVESKAPVLKRQREEYEGMQRSLASLCNKLEQARTEIYSLQKDKEEVKQHCEALQKEKARAERQLEDTSSQVDVRTPHHCSVVSVEGPSSWWRCVHSKVLRMSNDHLKKTKKSSPPRKRLMKDFSFAFPSDGPARLSYHCSISCSALQRRQPP